VAAGIVAALDRGRTGQRYILAGQTLSYMEALRIIAPITGQKPPFRTAIRPTIKLIGRLGDLWGWLIGHETEVNSAATTMSMLPKNYSSARAAAELGYHTRDVKQSATDAWEWLKKYGYVKA
jgi:dihydroflavonol-4-reductase